MDHHHLEVFEQTAEFSQLRLRGSTETQLIDRTAIDELVESVEDLYKHRTNATVVFGSAALGELGARLYEFLDGERRWMSKLTGSPGGSALRIDATERLRHLPWELMSHNDSYLAANATSPVLPIRSIGTHAGAGDAEPENRPLRVLFMATSPEGIEPELDFELEEAAILEAASEAGVELTVEESGTLDGLRFQAESYGKGYFDVLHISGHADVKEGDPVFLVEDELGRPAYAKPDDISRAMGGYWPRLVFVSGCKTGDAPGQGAFPSMSERLVAAGAPTVLGWGLPVGDRSATLFAAVLYNSLAKGAGIDEAICAARLFLHKERNPYWHFLRVYADQSPLTPMVTPINTAGRARLSYRPAAAQFLDPTGQVRVAAREEFVGRRRMIQRCLRTLKAPLDVGRPNEGLVLHGMGGLGKSTLASRLLERMPTHQRVVTFGRVDEVAFSTELRRLNFGSVEHATEAEEILAAPVPIEVKLRYLVNGPLSTVDCLFVFDDFEQGNLDEQSDGTHRAGREAAEILSALATAIRESNSRSRIVVTSRYKFPSPPGSNLVFVALETLNDTELGKKLRHLEHLSPFSKTANEDQRGRAIEASANNPRLLEWLNTVVGDPSLDAADFISAIEGKAEEFRTNIVAEKLIKSQGPEMEQMLARVGVVELPIPEAAVRAIYPDADDKLLERASALSLLEAGIDPETQEPRFYVSNVLRPLLALSEDEYKEACAAAAHALNAAWFDSRFGSDDNAERTN